MCRGYFLHSTVHWPNDNQACRRLQAAHRIDLEWIACAGAEVYIILGDGPLHTHLFYIDTLNFSSSDKRIDFDWKKCFSCFFPRAYCFVIQFWDFIKKKLLNSYAAAYNWPFFCFFSLAEYVPYLADIHFPYLQMGQLIFHCFNLFIRYMCGNQ